MFAGMLVTRAARADEAGIDRSKAPLGRLVLLGRSADLDVVLDRFGHSDYCLLARARRPGARPGCAGCRSATWTRPGARRSRSRRNCRRWHPRPAAGPGGGRRRVRSMRPCRWRPVSGNHPLREGRGPSRWRAGHRSGWGRATAKPPVRSGPGGVRDRVSRLLQRLCQFRDQNLIHWDHCGCACAGIAHAGPPRGGSGRDRGD